MHLAKIPLSARLSVAALFIVTKIMGHKQIAPLDFFDYVSGITIGSIGAELATELESPEKPAHIDTEIILDGRVMEENLLRMGRNATWLEKRLKAMGHASAKEIFSAFTVRKKIKHPLSQ